MATPASYDWIFLAAGWTVVALGAALLLRALFRDRSRGRRRCPKCWYDMSGVPGLQCPECGRTASSETRLLKTRRHCRRALVASLVVALGLGSAAVPQYRLRGWVSFVPSTVLIVISPGVEPPAPKQVMTFGYLPSGAKAPPPAPPPVPIRERLATETWRRLREGTMWQWQAGLFLHRLRAASPEDAPTQRVTLPARWPVSRPVPAQLLRPVTLGLPVRLRLTNGGEWQGYTPFTDPARKPIYATLFHDGHAAKGVGVETAMEIGKYTIPTGRAPATVELIESDDAVLERLGSADATRTVAAALRPRLYLVADRYLTFEFTQRSASEEWKNADFGVYFTVEVRAGGRALASGNGHVDWRGNGAASPDWFSLSWLEGAVERDPARGPVTLEVRGDPDAATRDYLQLPFVQTHAACWTGTLSIPIEAIERKDGPKTLSPAPAQPAK